MTGLFTRLFHSGAPEAAPERLGYEEARAQAQSTDPEVRRQLAARPDLVPEILYYLAEDPDAAVRREIAANHTTPAQANLLLATDTDIGVRTGLAEKIARLAPGLSAEEQDRLRRMTYQTLELLARDQVTRVRQILSEAMQDVAHAPPEVIRKLARDVSLDVARPVLENSPVLTDEDLLEIIQNRPIPGALSAISRRDAVGALVADAIAASEDIPAIAVLLGNPSAQIREETLDRLIARAPQHEEWHQPLVTRPRLPARAAARLAHFVADSLVQMLQQRTDFDAETMAAVAAVVKKRLEAGGPPEIRVPKPGAEAPVDKPMEVARQMHAGGMLDENLLATALGSNDRPFVMAALAVRADLPLEVVQKIVVTQSPKGIVALAWKAGLSIPFAVQLQSRLARIPPSDVIGPRKGAATLLPEEEMVWQLKFFGSLAGAEE